MTDLAFIESSEFNEFIKKNKDANTMQLRLKKFNNLSFDLEFALQQIECRKKATGKIPELAEKLIYPTQVSIEQATSEVLAKFHANLFAGQKTVLDLTCGLGVDDYYISERKTIGPLHCVHPKWIFRNETLNLIILEQQR